MLFWCRLQLRVFYIIMWGGLEAPSRFSVLCGFGVEYVHTEVGRYLGVYAERSGGPWACDLLSVYKEAV